MDSLLLAFLLGLALSPVAYIILLFASALIGRLLDPKPGPVAPYTPRPLSNEPTDEEIRMVKERLNGQA